VASDNQGDVVTSVNPARRGSKWKFLHITGRASVYNQLESLSCPTRSFCVTGSGDGVGYFSLAPGAAAPSWKRVQIDTDTAVYGDGDYGDALETLACPTISLCVAADADGNVLSTTDPTQQTPWKSERLGALPANASLVCTSTTLCILVDVSSVFISQDPTGSASSWQTSAHHTSPSAVACAKSRLCLLTYTNGNIVTGSLSERR
jgi:hypothetical protein